MLEDFIKAELETLENSSLLRRMREVKGFQGPKINLDGVNILNFCSNNYLGLAEDSRLGQAVVDSLKEEGFGAGASRLVCGNMDAHRQLESKMAQFKQAEDCIIFSSGYMANVGIISSLFGRDDIIYSDRLNHASIIDGIVLCKAKMRRYAHRDMQALEDMLKKDEQSNQRKKKCIVTDSVFSMDGDIAPLDKIVKLAKKYNCAVMIDEAHALGVMGNSGKGLAEHFGVQSDIDIQMGTFSKAVGSYGAYCCGSKNLIKYLVNNARSLIYTTGLPPSIACASLKAIEIIENEKNRRQMLWENARYVRAQIRLLGFDTLASETPIIPIVIKDAQKTVEFSTKLLEEGVFISAIRPPTVPENTSRLRMTIMASHKKQDLDFAIRKIKKVGEELCLI